MSDIYNIRKTLVHTPLSSFWPLFGIIRKEEKNQLNIHVKETREERDGCTQQCVIWIADYFNVYSHIIARFWSLKTSLLFTQSCHSQKRMLSQEFPKISEKSIDALQLETKLRAKASRTDNLSRIQLINQYIININTLKYPK